MIPPVTQGIEMMRGVPAIIKTMPITLNRSNVSWLMQQQCKHPDTNVPVHRSV